LNAFKVSQYSQETGLERDGTLGKGPPHALHCATVVSLVAITITAEPQLVHLCVVAGHR